MTACFCSRFQFTWTQYTIPHLSFFQYFLQESVYLVLCFCILFHLLQRFSQDVNGICTFWFYCTYIHAWICGCPTVSKQYIIMWEDSWQYWNGVRHRKKWWFWYDGKFLYFFFWKAQQHPLTCRWFCYLSHDVGRKRATTTSETTSKR